MTSSTPRRAILATAHAHRADDPDLEPLASAIARRGVDVAIADWRDPEAGWATADLVVVRSTWDYHEHPAAFLAWTHATSAVTTLCNGADLITWNHDKRYLIDLADAGVPVVATRVLAPAASDDDVRSTIAWAATSAGTGAVVKPTVSAGSRDTARYQPGKADLERAAVHARQLLDRGRAALVQPVIDSVDHHGETALIAIDGTWSHAVRKGPMLVRGAPPEAGPTRTEELTPRRASAAELAVGEDVLQRLGDRFGTPLYARVDLLATEDGPVVLEVEVIEPALFCHLAPGSIDRLADAICARLP